MNVAGSVAATIHGTPNVTLANGTTIATTETGFPYYLEAGTTGSVSGTVYGATRPTPQGGLQFITRVYNSTGSTFDLVIQGSYDGSNWMTISTSGAYANAFTTAATDAVLPFYRAFMRTGGGAVSAPNLTTWFGRGSADIGPIIRQYGGGQVGITNPLWITSNTNFGVTPMQNGSAVNSSNPLNVAATQGGSPVSGSNPLFVQPTQGGSAVSAAKPLYVQHLAATGVTVYTTTPLGVSASFVSAVFTPVATAVTSIIVTAVADQTGSVVLQGSTSTTGPWFSASQTIATTANVPTYITVRSVCELSRRLHEWDDRSRRVLRLGQSVEGRGRLMAVTYPDTFDEAQCFILDGERVFQVMGSNGAWNEQATASTYTQWRASKFTPSNTANGVTTGNRPIR